MDSIQLDGQSLQIFLDELRVKHNVVGATLGVLRDGAIETAASGLLNLDTGVECTSSSVFQIGSIGKVFTATLMMQLVDEGRIGLDEPAVKYVRDFVLADSAAASAITIRHLLNHTSGIDGDFFPADDPEGPSTSSYVRKMCLLSNLFPPGEGPMTYCNSGFVVAGRVIEVLTGMTWQNAVMERICKPLGLPSAFAHPHEALRYRCAIGHVPDRANVKRLIPAAETYLSISMAAAGSVLSMSAESLLLFAKAHIADGEFADGKRLFSVESARAMREEKKPILPFMRPGVTHWGLGWFLGEDKNYNMAGHDGATLGQFAYLRTFPKKDIAFALLTNSPSKELFAEVEERLVSALVGTKIPADPPREDFEPVARRYVGEYANVSSKILVDCKGNRLSIRIDDFSDGVFSADLVPYSADIFTLQVDNPILSGQKIMFLDTDDNSRALFARLNGRMARRIPVAHRDEKL